MSTQTALKPIAGELAFALLSPGIIRTDMLALPVLAGSAAYAAAGVFRWRNSLALQVNLAKEFYAAAARALHYITIYRRRRNLAPGSRPAPPSTLAEQALRAGKAQADRATLRVPCWLPDGIHRSV